MLTPEQARLLRERIRRQEEERLAQAGTGHARHQKPRERPLEDQVERARNLTRNMVSLEGADHVDVCMSKDNKTLWINVDGVCVLRICRIKKMDLTRA